MASPQEDALVSTQQASPEETSKPGGLPPRQRGTAGSEGGEPADVGFRCAAGLCFRLPCRSKSKKTPPPVKLVPSRSMEEEEDASAAAQRVTFLASASLSTWWPPADGDFVVERRASGRGVTSSPSSARSGGRGGSRRTLSSSFSYWRRSLSSSRVTPHGAAASARVSFSFPSSPVSVSSCMSTPKISHGGCHE